MSLRYGLASPSVRRVFAPGLAVGSPIERHRVRARLVRELVGHQLRDAAHDAVDEPLRLRAADVVREFHRLVDGGVLGHVREERELERAEVQHVPHARLDRVERDLDERLEERVERAPCGG